jgi:hypothetical protein
MARDGDNKAKECTTRQQSCRLYHRSTHAQKHTSTAPTMRISKQRCGSGGSPASITRLMYSASFACLKNLQDTPVTRVHQQHHQTQS